MSKKTSEWEKELSEITFRIDCSVAETKQVENQLKQFISDLLAKEKMELIERIDPFDLVEPCNPDCTPVEHAYHEGTWHARLKLEKILKTLKSEEKEEVGGQERNK